MSMTTELIERLKNFAKDYETVDTDTVMVLNEAAYTIQLLSEKLHASQMERSSQYYHGGWIPCEERLPEPNTAVLTCIDTGANKTYCLAYWNDVRNGWEEWIGYDLIEKERGYKVLAWLACMPLPESNKADKE